MNAIVAVDKNFAIGRNNELLFHIPEDMKIFKKLTTDKIVVMGRKTFDSIGKKLPNRINIVITNNNPHYPDSIAPEYIGNMETAEELIELFNSEDVFIIGGASIYKHFIDRCDAIYLTSYDTEYKDADAYFPNPYNLGFHEVERLWESVYKARYYKIAKLVK